MTVPRLGRDPAGASALATGVDAVHVLGCWVKKGWNWWFMFFQEEVVK
jgi:hypothetical protein